MHGSKKLAIQLCEEVNSVIWVSKHVLLHMGPEQVLLSLGGLFEQASQGTIPLKIPTAFVLMLLGELAPPSKSLVAVQSVAQLLLTPIPVMACGCNCKIE